jgi:hypothetical protein
MMYTCCPACNGKRRKATGHPGVFECRRCGALYGECWKGDSYALVLPVMTADPVPPERCRYYDLTVLGSDGVTRRHGWFDVETRRMFQVG